MAILQDHLLVPSRTICWACSRLSMCVSGSTENVVLKRRQCPSSSDRPSTTSRSSPRPSLSLSLSISPSRGSNPLEATTWKNFGEKLDPSWIFKSNTNFVQFFSIAERGVVLAGVPAEAAEGRWCGRTTVSRVVVIVKRVINIIIISSRSRSSSWSSRSGGDSARDYHSDTTRKSWKDEGGTERRAMQ